MRKRHTLIIFLAIVAAYVLLLLPGLFLPAYLDSPAGSLALVPFLSIQIFHNAGVPGLLDRNGLCDGGWCSPTLWGWTLAAVVWLVAAWTIAYLIAGLTTWRAGR